MCPSRARGCADDDDGGVTCVRRGGVHLPNARARVGSPMRPGDARACADDDSRRITAVSLVGAAAESKEKAGQEDRR
jgi:hypothetical protein